MTIDDDDDDNDDDDNNDKGDDDHDGDVDDSSDGDDDDDAEACVYTYTYYIVCCPRYRTLLYESHEKMLRLLMQTKDDEISWRIWYRASVENI